MSLRGWPKEIPRDEQSREAMRAGVDVGGTFTDFVAFRSGQFVTSKVPSRPREPDAAVVAGMRALGADSIAHGTTVATNAIVERRGARTPPVPPAGAGGIPVEWAPNPPRRLRRAGG